MKILIQTIPLEPKFRTILDRTFGSRCSLQERNRRTNRMRADWFGVDSKERHSNEGTVVSQAEYRISQLEGSMVLVGITLVEVNV